MDSIVEYSDADCLCPLLFLKADRFAYRKPNCCEYIYLDFMKFIDCSGFRAVVLQRRVLHFHRHVHVHALRYLASVGKN